MRFDINLTQSERDGKLEAAIVKMLAHSIQTTRQLIMASNDQLNTRLHGILEAVAKVQAETAATQQSMTELRAHLEGQPGGGQIDPEITAKLDEIEARLRATDAIVEDVPTA